VRRKPGPADRIAYFLAALLALAAPAAARTIQATPTDYADALRALQPGDTLALAPGQYARGLRVHGLLGTPDAPITIEGPARGAPATFVARREANTVSLLDVAHVVIRNLVLDGRGLSVDAVKAEGHARFAHHITLENLRIVGHGDDQQTVGISTKCPAWGWVIRRNLIQGAGTGIYLGGSDGGAPFFHGVIEGNTVVNPRGYALQIKHQHRRPELDGVPDAPGFTVIRGNRFIKSAGGATGEHARPNVLVGHFPLEGRGAGDFYVIYGNVFQDNPTGEALFQGEGNVALYNNLFLNPAGDAVRLQPHNHLPRAAAIFHNTVIAGGVGIAVLKGEPGYRRYVGRNAVFAAEPLRAEQATENFLASLDQARRHLVAPVADPAKRDFAPRAGALASGAVLPDDVRRFPGWSVDFQGLRRLGQTVGACQPPAGQGPRRPCR
jgi:hypothetical protein